MAELTAEQVAANEASEAAKAAEATKETKAPEAFKAFATEDEYNNSIKSERSKAKNEILQELGLSNVADGKTALSKAATLEAELTTHKEKTQGLEEQLTLNKLGIKGEYAEEALALAKGKINETVDLAAALTEVSKKFPIMLGETKVPAKVKVGGDKTEEKDTAEAGTLKANLSKKYPWLKF